MHPINTTRDRMSINKQNPVSRLAGEGSIFQVCTVHAVKVIIFRFPRKEHEWLR